MTRCRCDWVLVAVAIVVGPTALVSCFDGGDSDASVAPSCIPGESRLCHCADGKAGRQVCRDDGKSLAPCECQPAEVAKAPDAAPAVLPSIVTPPPLLPAVPVPPSSLPPPAMPSSPMNALALAFQEDSATVALWHFDEGAGTATADSGPYKLTSTLRSTTWSQGRFGGALAMAGSANMQSVSSEAFFPTAAITIEAWIRPEASSFMTVYDVQETQSLGLRPRGTDAEVVFTLRINEVVRTLVSTEPVAIRQWHHAAGTFDGTTMRLWIDGQLRGELVTPGALTRAMRCETPTIGSDCTGTSGWYNGAVDEVRVSNVVRYVPDGTVAAAGDAGPATTADGGTKTTKRTKRDKTLGDVAEETTREALKVLGIGGNNR
jgi:hypothetical protein